MRTLALAILCACGPHVAPIPVGSATSVCRHVSVREVSSVGAPVIDVRFRPDSQKSSVIYAGPAGDRVVYAVAAPKLVAHIYDPATDRWRTVEGGEVPRHADRVWPIAGGRWLVLAWQGRPLASSIHIEALDLDAGTLREIPLGPPTFNGLVQIVGDALYVWPGTAPNTYPPPIDFAHGQRFDLESWSWSELPAGPAPATLEARAVTGDDIFVWTDQGTAMLFDTKQLAWRTLHAPLKMHASAYAWRGRVAVIGSASTGPHDTFVYDVAADTWRAAGRMPELDSAGGWRGGGVVGPYLAELSAGVPGAVFDLRSAQWARLPVTPPLVPALDLHMGERAIGFLGPDRIAVLDLDDRSWCSAKVDVPVLAADEHVLSWGGATIGAWGALDPVEHPPCPPGAPCVDWPDEYTAREIGSVVRW